MNKHNVAFLFKNVNQNGLEQINNLCRSNKKLATLNGPRVTDISEGVEGIEFQFKEGQFFGYRDSKSKIVYFKTVYSNDMLRGDRLAFREEWKDSISQLHELFKRNS